jgi:hypothetical protein
MIDADFSRQFARLGEGVERPRSGADPLALRGGCGLPFPAHPPGDGPGCRRVSGKAELRDYWGQALARLRDLFFEIDQVLPGSDALTILYTNERSQYVAETFVFDESGKVIRSIAAYV